MSRFEVESRLHYLLFIPLLLLSSCRSSQQSDLDKASSDINYANALAECDKLAAGVDVTRKNAVNYYKCIYQVKLNYGFPSDSSEMLTARKRLDLAVDYAAGKINQSEYRRYNQELDQPMD